MSLTFSRDSDGRHDGRGSGLVTPVPGARPSSTTSAPLTAGLSDNSTYSGADIKLIVHFPSGVEIDETTRERIEDLELQIADAERTLAAYSPTGSSIPGQPPRGAPDLSGLSPGDRQRVEAAFRTLETNRGTLETLRGESRQSRVITKVLAEIQTISLSIFRVKLPVRALGHTYVKGYSRGTVSIAGSMIFTMFNKNVWTEVLETFNSSVDHSYRDEDPYNFTTVIPHQLPPMDITVSFANEYGNVSYLAIYGVEILNEGLTLSVNDLFPENTYTYTARDVSLVSDLSVAQRSSTQSSGEFRSSQLSRSDLDHAEAIRAIRENPYR